jgi:hypothetical protein
MKIGWYTHHIENVTNVADNGSVSQQGLFTGQFAGGAEMSDYEYRLQAPLGLRDRDSHPRHIRYTRHTPIRFGHCHRHRFIHR